MINSLYTHTPYNASHFSKPHITDPQRKKQNGLTLIEILTTLSIIILTTAVGIPSFNGWLQQKAEVAVFRHLFHLVAYTRTEAIKANTYYTLCPTTNQINCSGDWNDTVMIFSDHNKNETVDDSDALFKLIQFPNTTPCIYWNLEKRQYVQFKPTGFINGTAGHFRFCDNVDSSYDKKLVVSFNGRTSIKSL
jgi:type IV fimbrial biogenesis protein FimT